MANLHDTLGVLIELHPDKKFVDKMNEDGPWKDIAEITIQSYFENKQVEMPPSFEVNKSLPWLIERTIAYVTSIWAISAVSFECQ